MGQTLKDKAIRIVNATRQRINKEKNPDKKWRLIIIKREFDKLADQL